MVILKIDMDLSGAIFDGVMGEFHKKKEIKRKGMDLEKLFEVFNKTEEERVRIRALIKKEKEEGALEAKLERSKTKLHETYDNIDKTKEKRKTGEVRLMLEHRHQHQHQQQHPPATKPSKSKPSTTTCPSRLIQKIKTCKTKNHTNKFRRH